MTKSSDLTSLRELSRQFAQIEAILEQEMNANPEVQKLVNKVGSTLISYKQTALATIRGYERTYQYLHAHPEANISPKLIADDHRDPIQFMGELGLWLNIKAGADPYKAWKKLEKSMDKNYK